MKKTKGFTLIELIITMTIVVVLSLISWPIYRSFHLKEISMLSEGYALIGAIKDAQIHYYNEYGNFLSGKDSYGVLNNIHTQYTAACPVLGINVMNNRYFTKFNYDHIDTGNSWNFRFTARVFGNFGSGKTVSITMPYNLTERQDIVINGTGYTTTISGY